MKKLSMDFKTKTPVLPDVKILEEWAYYDGPLFGVCEIRGRKFFYIDAIYDTWRFYEDDTSQRLWCIYAVYDIDIKQAKKIIGDCMIRGNWEGEIISTSNCIGIFWEYEKELVDGF